MRKLRLRRIGDDLWGIIRLQALFIWYCYIVRKPELFVPIMEAEKKELGIQLPASQNDLGHACALNRAMDGTCFVCGSRSGLHNEVFQPVQQAETDRVRKVVDAVTQSGDKNG